MKLFYALLLICHCGVLFAQSNKFSIDWGVDKTNSEEVLLENLTLSEISDKTWVYSYQWDVGQEINTSTAQLRNIQYEVVPRSVLSQIDQKKVSNDLETTFNSSKARSRNIASVTFMPFVKKNGQMMRVISGEVSYAFAKAQSRQQRSAIPITNSVLASGSFFKFYVENTGVHRIDRNFLESLGMDTDNISTSQLKVYGYGGSPLPLLNSDNEVFDLREIPIQIEGGGDGSFDRNDAVLFYGESSRKFHTALDTHVNPYSDRSYYYVTAQGADGLRIQPYVEPVGVQSATFSSYDNYKFHEEDINNLARVGRRWFGERFNFETEQSFEFSFPNAIVGEEADLRVVVAAVSESATSFDVLVNGALVGSVNLSAISDIVLARGGELNVAVPIVSEDIVVTLVYNNNANPSSIGYLDFISLDVPTSLSGTGEQFVFENGLAMSQTGIGAYALNNLQGYSQIWDVTDQTSVAAINLNGETTSTFKTELGNEQLFVAVTPSNYFSPLRENRNTEVRNQNIKGTVFQSSNGSFEDVDYLMITSETLRPQAERLAQHNRSERGLNVKTITLEDIYEEFGGGRQDIGAIRNFVRYVYDNASSEDNRLKYVCLFGDTSVDYKDRLVNNNNIVPTYQTFESFDLVRSFMSDDFFGNMDADEGEMRATERLDIAVGRIVADTPELATILVDKIINYDARSSFGRWRNNFVLVSDDVDEVLEFNALQGNLDELGDEVSAEKPFVNVFKIHSDSFEQQSSSGGDRYPQVNEAISNAIEIGALAVTYLGHGGEELLSSEAIVTQSVVDNLDNGERLPLVITVTCEFGKFDNPERPTGAERLLWNPDGGAVALVTTTREIFVSLGVDFNDVLAEQLFSFGSNEIVSIAENVRVSKNGINDPLRRVIFYCGDPAMKLAFARPDIQLTAINDTPVENGLPTLRALDLVKVNGRVTNESGQTITDYNGTLAATLFDKEIDRQTLGNDGVRNSAGELLIMDFKTLGAILYRGQASVENGVFEFTFRMPRDTSIPVGNGRLNFYSERTGILEDQTGVNTDVLIGGLNENAPIDNEGPIINLFLNDESFVNGGITNNAPIILAKLEDENGINTASGIGHDIVAIIDGDEENPVIMNEFYETEVNDFTRGIATRKIRDLEPGLHTLTFKAWDVYNNSSTAELQFIVIESEELELGNVLNYPNPFVNYTEFWFNHNRPFEPLDVQVQIFTISGKVVKTINQSVVTDGFLSRDITWDGKDDFGQAIGKGVYVYKITVKSTLTNKRVEKFEKLVIL